MKRILKSIVEFLGFAGDCICPSVVVYPKPDWSDMQWSSAELAYIKEISEKHKINPLLINKIKLGAHHEKPTPNPYATYLCINGNGS